MQKRISLSTFKYLLVLLTINIIGWDARPSSLKEYRDYNTEDSEDFFENPAYRMIVPIKPLIIEYFNIIKYFKDQDDPKIYDLDHAIRVSITLKWYISPHEPSIRYVDFNNSNAFPTCAQLEEVFEENPAPFVNCSFGPIKEWHDTYDALSDLTFIHLKCFIECAIKKGKILIFSGGNENQRSMHFLPQLNLTHDQKKQILFVGALQSTKEDNKQTPALYSAIAGQGEGEFIWAVGQTFPFQKRGTSLAAPCVTGLLCRLIGVYPQLTAQEAIDIMFTTANKSPFLSTNDPELDEYLYGRHGAIDARAALQFAAKFVKAKTEGQDLVLLSAYQQRKPSFSFSSKLRDKLNLMNFLEQHHAGRGNGTNEKKIQERLKQLAQEITLQDLYKQFKFFFERDDMHALKNIIPKDNDKQFEKFIKLNFSANKCDSLEFTPLDHVIEWNHPNLIKHYVERLPESIKDSLMN